MEEVLKGLNKKQKQLSPKFLYDQRGSELFEKITTLPEYYVTRTEISILKQYALEMADVVGEEAVLVEYGSGSSTKIKLLLDHLPNLSAYMPIDISKEFLKQSAEALAREYHALKIIAICADYTSAFNLPEIGSHSKKVAFFPGSTIGNFDPLYAQKFLRKIAKMLQTGDGLLIGVDLKKDRQTLHDAYNDKQGITAAFNLNMLTRINNELGANFEFNQFQHKAFYNEEFGRIEMHIQSLVDQEVAIGENSFSFKRNETIHTENSYKYTIHEFQTMAKESGFKPVEVWTDQNEWFSVHYLTVNG
ncbi:L-histidine N(alpha)-methyltransferase [Bacillus taeanensis]|uniref:L-histidine N(Alpha)-methyltransferase n=2 Tax=Bacillus taeanensis TaxID=273032 RepID=A0A366Y372_9BACI|nr:L-histidine N(alpha)-methyltransferase [Bacillus taeanensis]